MQLRRHVLGLFGSKTYQVLRLGISFSFISSKMYFTFDTEQKKYFCYWSLEASLICYPDLFQTKHVTDCDAPFQPHNVGVMLKASVRSYMDVLLRKPFIFRWCCGYQIACQAANKKKVWEHQSRSCVINPVHLHQDHIYIICTYISAECFKCKYQTRLIYLKHKRLRLVFRDHIFNSVSFLILLAGSFFLYSADFIRFM